MHSFVSLIFALSKHILPHSMSTRISQGFISWLYKESKIKAIKCLPHNDVQISQDYNSLLLIWLFKEYIWLKLNIFPCCYLIPVSFILVICMRVGFPLIEIRSSAAGPNEAGGTGRAEGKEIDRGREISGLHFTFSGFQFAHNSIYN